MKYFEVIFSITAHKGLMQDARDLLSALAGEAGFETFEETSAGITGYVQQSLFSKQLLDSLICDFPIPQVSVGYTVNEVEDKDWNEQWEQEGFDPICISLQSDTGRGRLIVHDGRHVPYEKSGNDILIEIDARLAFGTGTHETTRLMLSALLSICLEGCRVLDCGTGTGILAIAALKRGAASAVGYDIDEWSVDNARHNAVINSVDSRFTPLLGDASVLQQVEGTFDVVTANINRNILLADMADFVSKMAPKAILLLSGFYSDDIPMLLRHADALGLKKKAQQLDGHWACLVLSREVSC